MKGVGGGYEVEKKKARLMKVSGGKKKSYQKKVFFPPSLEHLPMTAG